jgi:hypothetical protein
MQRPLDRPISSAELAVLRAAFAVGSQVPDSERFTRTADKLWVVAGCACGCDTVDFRRSDTSRPYGPLADAYGTTPGGGEVGVIVFGTDDEITCLEVYDAGVREDGICLPDLASIRGYSAPGAGATA